MTVTFPTVPATSFHFVLVHGSCHGALCWYRLISLLEAAGHKAKALDLAGCGTNQVPFDDLKTVDDYHRPLFSYLEALPSEEKVILVGHSWGGYAVSFAMERFPTKIILAVFVSSFMVGPDLSYDQLNEKFIPTRAGTSEDCIFTIDKSTGRRTGVLFGPKFMLEQLYQQSPNENFLLSTLLIRTAKYFDDDKSKHELLVTKEKYGTVRRAYFIGEANKAISAEFQKWMTEKNPPNEVRTITGADHMVMISTPQELCQNLLEVAK